MVAASCIPLVACGSGEEEPTSAGGTSAIETTANGGGSPAAVAERRRDRQPGCGSFCRQAGGFGAGPRPAKMPVAIPSQTIKVDRNGIFGVRATCQLDRRCVGAIVVAGVDASYGRADLRIAAHTTRVVLVGSSRQGLRYLRRHGRDRVVVNVPLVRNDVLSFSGLLTLLAPR